MNPLTLLLYVFTLSLVLFAAMGADKRAAKKGKHRIPEKRLFVLALLGGAPGGTLGMFLFRHKTRHLHFRLIFPFLALLQFGLCYVLCANGM